MFHALALLAAVAAGVTSSPVVTIRREGSPGITELTTGIAISSHHVITLSAFAAGPSVPLVEVDGQYLEPDTVYSSEGLGLAILVFDGRPFTSYASPAGSLPESGDLLTLAGQGVGGLVSIGGRVMRIYEDGAVLVSAPRMDGLMGAGAFDSDDELVGLVNGVITTRLESTPAGSAEHLAILPSPSWSVWADLVMAGRWASSTPFGVTATACSSEDADERPSGVLIVAVDDGSTACRCGLRPGDLVVSLDGERIYNPETMRGLLLSAGDSLDAVVWFHGNSRTIKLAPLR